ncbi:MAG: Hsp20/alpha crystallin family protein [Desulfuromonadaceae bacterium]
MANWDLFREMDALRREIDEAFRGFGMSQFQRPTFFPGLGTGDFPRINLSEDEHNLYVEALVPGLTPQDLDLNILHGALTLSGERKENGTDHRTWHRRERGNDRFLRTIELPTPVDVAKVDAEYHNGILTVTLPKAEEAKPKKIAVKIN